MRLRWDPVLTRHLAAELDALLAGCRLRAVRLDGDSRELALFFREHLLVWSLHPERGAPRLLPAAEPSAADLPLPTRVRRVWSPPDERVVRLELLPTRRGRRGVDVIVELLGNQWNAIFAEGRDARIRHVLVRRSGARELQVGGRYEAPAPSPREGRDAPISLDRWHEILDPVPADRRAGALVRSVAWTSPLSAPALVARLDDGYDAWREIAHGGGAARPVLLGLESGAHPYPFPLPGVPWSAAQNLLAAFERSGAGAGPAPVEAEAGIPSDLVSALERTLDTALRRVTALEAERAAVEDPGDLRAAGDLLLARLSQVPRGSSSVGLVDFSGAPVQVELDPALTPAQNAEAYYDRAAKAERARERLPALLAEAREVVVELETLRDGVRSGAVDAPTLRAALPQAAAPDGGARARAAPAPPYLRFRSSGGLEIRVGRGPRHNDDLTFRHSAPNDVWLHAQQSPGAHVILRWGRSEPPPARDLAEAAGLAALNSRARGSARVPVAWTFRKYVRKPRGAAPGSVVPERVKTLFVEPDPTLAERLAYPG